ncbi:hypothetical protein CJU90_3905 [Yarrowia sp. C11]|nr:hypothetical protein CJU90_3905 [Yarrowia sp. C11]
MSSDSGPQPQGSRPAYHVWTASPPSRIHSVSPTSTESPLPMNGYPHTDHGPFRAPYVSRPPRTHLNGSIQLAYEPPKAETRENRPKIQLLGPGVSIREGDEGVIPQEAFLYDQPVFGPFGALHQKTEDESTVSHVSSSSFFKHMLISILLNMLLYNNNINNINKNFDTLLNFLIIIINNNNILLLKIRF